MDLLEGCGRESGSALTLCTLDLRLQYVKAVVDIGRT